MMRTSEPPHQVDVTVGQIGGGPRSLDDLETERIGVEFHQSINVFREM